MTEDRGVVEFSADRAAEAVAVLCEAFHDYPVMRFVVGPAGADYDRHLATLIEFFVMARFRRHEPVLAVFEGEVVAAVAVVTPPGDRESPPALAEHREAVWRALGSEARARYEAFGEAGGRFGIDQPHHHLNMIGVRKSHAGRGLARRLLEAVHARSLEDPDSCGVTLTTEDPANLPLYEHFGYKVVGHVRVSPDLETWAFFRPDAPT